MLSALFDKSLGYFCLSIKSEGDLQNRAISTAHKLWPILVGIAVIFLVVSAFSTNLYENFLAYPSFCVHRSRISDLDLSFF
jgi:cytochrome bd-type quinol oxidase subunit 2